MYKIELAFMNSVIERNHEDAIKYFENIFDKLISYYNDDERAIKNHLITINGMLYKSYKEEGNLEEVFKIRSDINAIIEDSDNFESLREECMNMVDSYLNVFIGSNIKTNNNTVNEALNYMRSHLNENLSLGTVASKIHISKSYLSSLLAKHTKSSFPELLTDIRMNNAKYLLKNTNISILDISYRCGYNSQSYFCSTFKKETGYTPTDFREKRAD